MEASLYKILPGLIDPKNADNGLGMVARKLTGYTPAETVALICQVWEITPTAIYGPTRSGTVVEARHVASYFLKHSHRQGPSATARRFNRTHPSVLHSYKKVRELFETDPAFRCKVVALCE